jgi:hypothetical protein
LPGVLKRVDGLVVLSYLVMDMWTGRSPCAAGVANLVAALDTLSCLDSDLRQVAVTAGDAVAVIYNDKVAISRIGSRPDYKAVRRS